MESTTTDQQIFGAEASLPEPHFDEEATMLSARPVVPLAAVEDFEGNDAVGARTFFPRPWMLGLALIGALLVGVFATAIYFSRSDGSDSSVFDVAEVAGGVKALSTEGGDSFSGPAATELPGRVNSDAEVKSQPLAKDQPANTGVEPGRKPVPRLVEVIREKRASSQTVVDSREDRKAERKQARQERRRAEREKRSAESPSDLLRIRDIFEGSPRP